MTSLTLIAVMTLLFLCGCSNKTKVERLKELKQMLDEKLINQEEFEKQKQKILDEQ